MALTEEDKARIAEEEAHRAKVREEEHYRQSLHKQTKTSSNKPGTKKTLLIIVGLMLVLGVFGGSMQPKSSTTESSLSPTTELSPTDSPSPTPDVVWNASKAGQICSAHPEWTREECDRIADSKIWVGMTYDMLVYEFGTPDHIHPSNYGNGTSYQYCYEYRTSTCFYDNNGDGIIDAYN